MWERELNTELVELEKADPEKKVEGERIGSRANWYSKQKTYWDAQPATVDGVLGGYGHLSKMEAIYSLKVFENHVALLPGTKRAFEVGAGIGRISKEILKHAFEEIDILDQSPVQIAEAKNYVPFVKK